MRTFSRAVVLAVVAASLCAGTPELHAQQQIPDTVITSGSVSKDGLDAINALVNSAKAGLSSTNQDELKRARTALLTPLRVTGVSSDFRTAYSSVVTPVLQPLIADKRDTVAVSALSIAGELCTREGLELSAKGLADTRPQVRVRAALAHARTFVACRDSAPALLPAQVDTSLKALQTMMTSEQDGHVLDALGSALEAAMRIPDTKVEGSHAKAFDAMTSGASAAIRRQQGAIALVPLEIRATRAMYEYLRDHPAPGVSNPAAVQAAGTAGDAIHAASKHLETPGGISDELRGQLSLVATQGERVILSSGERLKLSMSEAKLGDMLAKGEDEKFKAEVAKLLGPGGTLTKPPFGLPAERFTK